MDVNFFLVQRTAFIRQFYEAASPPFAERMRKIENKEEPYVPPYSEDGEPPFLEEWIEANESLQILGYTCVSMLAAALHLFFKTWEKQLRTPAKDAFKAGFKKGWINGYKAYFEKYVDIEFEDGPVNLFLLEEIVLARNEAQHPKDISNQVISHPANYSGNRSHSFFMTDREREAFTSMDETEQRWLLPPRLHISGERLFAAILEVEKFCEWLDENLVNRIYKR